MLTKVKPSPSRYAVPRPDGGYEIFTPSDEPLSPAEKLAERQEQLYRARAKQRIPGQEDRTDPYPRLGRPLHHTEIIHRLRKLIPSLTLRDGVGTNISLYSVSPNGEALNFLGFVYRGDNPEYSTWLLGPDDVPTAERRGWRTTLLRLILSGRVTEQQIDKTFPRPSNGATASAYRRQLFNFRNPRSVYAREAR